MKSQQWNGLNSEQRTSHKRKHSSERTRRDRSVTRSVLRKVLQPEKLGERVVFSGASAMAVNDLYEAMMDEPLQVEMGGVLANDVDAENDTLTAEQFFAPQNGELNLNEDGTFTYQPNPGFTGIDGFVYQVDDGTSKSSLAAVTIEVNDPNIAPVGENDFFATDEDSVLEVVAENGVLANDQDENDDSLTLELVDSPTNGTLELREDGGFSYTPAPEFEGTDAFTYRLSDGAKQSDLVAVEIQVNAINDAPVAQGESFIIAEDGMVEVNSAAVGLLANDSDPENPNLAVVPESEPENGQLTLNEDGTFSYIPNPDFHGVDAFSYRVSDGEMLSEAVEVTITVEAIYDAPVANNDFFSVQEDTPIEFSGDDLFANDEQKDATDFTVEIVDPPVHGSLVQSDDGKFLYTPEADFFGVDAFTYRLADPSGASELAVAEIEVESINDAPIANADAMETEMDTPVSISPARLLANDVDADGDELMVTIVTEPGHGSVELSEDGSFVFTPNAGFVGQDQFTYEVSDGEETAQAIVSLNIVDPIPVIPQTANESFDATAGETLTIAGEAGLLANETRDGDLQVVLFRGPAHGDLELNDDGSFEFTPAADFEGVDSILYRTTDGETESRLGVTTLYIGTAIAVPGEDVPSTPGDPTTPDGEAPVETPPAVDIPVADIAEDGDAELSQDEHLDCWDAAFEDIEQFWFDMRRMFT
ncbi:MAG: Ig-like domain-containing protein [Pirellulaceae bacterium]